MWSTESIAESKSCFCRCGSARKSLSVLFVLTLGSLAMTPVPEQGASRSTRSNPPMSLGKLRASSEQMIVFLTPMRWIFPIRALLRDLLLSFAKMVPVLRIRAAMWVVFPPGAAAMSRMRSFSWGARAMTGRSEEAAWIMYFPAR